MGLNHVPPSSSWCTSKEHIFNVELGFWQKELILRLKHEKKWHHKMPLHLAAENGHFTMWFSHNLQRTLGKG